MRQLGLLFLFIFLIPLASLTSPARADITAEASLDTHSFPVDRAARLTITVSGARTADIQMVEVEGLRFHNRGQSSQVNIINGNYSSSISSNYLIQALKPGSYTIPPLSIIAGSKTVQTKAITFEATPAGQNSPAESNSNSGNSSADDNEIAFISFTEVSKHYSGEVVPVTIKAYFNQKYRANINSLPVLKTDGVVMSPLSNKPEQTQERLNGATYSVLNWETTLSGIKVGNHPIRFELDATLNIPQQRRMSPFGGSSLFDDSFFNSFFGGVQQKPIKVVSPESHFEVVELPKTGQPENFTGAIGDFRLTVSASPKQVEVGEPITLTIEIAGKGNFDQVEAPDFPSNSEWRTYSPTSDYSGEGNVFSGTKRFEQAIVAKNGTLTRIPSLSFSYFNPEKESYITISSAPIEIEMSEPDIPVNQQQPIQAAAAPQKQGPDPSTDAVPGISSLAPLHLETGTFYPRITPFYKRIWFISGVGCCILLLLFVLFFNIHTRNLSRHPELQLQKKRRRMLSKSLTKLSQAKDAGDAGLFLTLCRQTLQQQLGLIWNVEGAAISLADIKTRLGSQSSLVEIFQAAEQAAYGSSALAPETMHVYFENLHRELEELI